MATQKPATSNPSPAPSPAPKSKKQNVSDAKSNDYDPIDEDLHLASNGTFSAQPMVAPTQLNQPTMI